MTSDDFWYDIDERIMDIIQLIRLNHPIFNNTPIEKVVYHLVKAYKASGQVSAAIDTGWLQTDVEAQRNASKHRSE